MLVNLYKSKTPIAVFSFPLLIGLLGLPIFFAPNPITPSFFLWENQFIELVLSSNVTHYISAVLILYISAIEINRLVNSYGFYSRNTYLPGLIFALAVFSFDQVRFSMVLLAYGFLIYGIGFLFRINRQDPAKSSIFISSLFFGIATVFEPLLCPIIVLPWFTLVVFRSFNWREWFMLLLGIGIPWLYHYGIYYSATGETEILNEGLSIKATELNFTPAKISLFTYMVLITIYSIWKFLIILNSQLLVFKKRSRLLFHFIWLMVISFGLGWFFYDYLIVAAAIPFSIIVAVQMLNSSQNMTTNLVLLGWIGLIVWNLVI